MNEIAFLTWQWQAASRLHTGTGQNLAEYSGRISHNAKNNVNLETHRTPDNLAPAFLASSVKGVFRSVAAWWIERTARELGETQYVTCDYNSALETTNRPRQTDPARRQRPFSNRLCPVTLVFGGLTCPPESERDKVALRRQVSRTYFFFGRQRDAFHGTVAKGATYHFSWERAENSWKKELHIEELEASGAVELVVRLDEASDYALALLWLAGDLVSSGAFRFGKFTSRGFGHVRLQPIALARAPLDTWLGSEQVVVEPISLMTGLAAAQHHLGEDPRVIVKEFVRQWLEVGA